MDSGIVFSPSWAGPVGGRATRRLVPAGGAVTAMMPAIVVGAGSAGRVGGGVNTGGGDGGGRSRRVAVGRSPAAPTPHFTGLNVVPRADAPNNVMQTRG